MAQFLIKGVDRETGDDMTVLVDAETEANARVKGELQGIIVTEVIPQDIGVVVDSSETADEQDGLTDEPDATAAIGEGASDDTFGPERPLWSGHPSHLSATRRYLGWFVALALALALAAWTQWWWFLILAAVCIIAIAWAYLVVKNTCYELTTQRLVMTEGVISSRVEEVELYRIKDFQVDQPIVERLVGIGNVTLVTLDPTTPSVTLRAIPNPKQVRDTIRDHVLINRKSRGIREIDFE